MKPGRVALGPFPEAMPEHRGADASDCSAPAVSHRAVSSATIRGTWGLSLGLGFPISADPLDLPLWGRGKLSGEPL